MVLAGGDPVVETDHLVLAAHGEDGVEGRGDERDDLVGPGHVVGRDRLVHIDVVDRSDLAPIAGGLGGYHGLDHLDVCGIDLPVEVGVAHVDVRVVLISVAYDLADGIGVVRRDVRIQIGVAEDGETRRVVVGSEASVPAAVVQGHRGDGRRGYDQRNGPYRYPSAFHSGIPRTADAVGVFNACIRILN